ncbi:MAG TPA: isochorismatase [Thermoanaerobaculia bacterium]
MDLPYGLKPASSSPSMVSPPPSASTSALLPSAAMAESYAPFEERRIRYHGLRQGSSFRTKLYSVTFDGTDLDWEEFERGLDAAGAALPTPARAPGRPGLAIAIAHHGSGGDYVVLAWWERQNELPTRIFVRDGDRWRPASDESFCVWDLEILWAERNAYVRTVLGGQMDVEGYLRSGPDGRWIAD